MANTFIFDDEPQPEPGNQPAPDQPGGPEQPESGEGNNRTFLILAILLGGVVLLSLLCMAGYVLLVLPGQRASAAKTAEANAAANTEVAAVEMATQEAALWTATLPPTETATIAPTETLVIVFASATPTVANTVDPATATVEAMYTQLAMAQATSGKGTPQSGAAGTAEAAGTLVPGTPGTPGTPGQLARTGFADEVGLPGLLAIAVILVAVILLARRLRQTPLSH